MFARRRPLLRAAVVGGGAYMAGKAAANRRDAAASQQADQDAPAVPSQRSEGSPMMDQLDRLTELHQQGALTDEEFSAAKAKLLGS
jgi:Short C-terminal domain